MSPDEGGRIGVFGGSFNPPHRGHEETVAALLEHDLVDRIWVVPVHDHPFGKDLAPFEDRLAMCRLAFAAFGSRVQVSDVERDLAGPSYTVRTLEELGRRLPGGELFLVIGSDTLRDTKDWMEFERIRQIARLLVVPRRGGEPAPEALDIAPPAGVSSTEVRHRLGRGEPVEGLVNLEVAAYIVTHDLYRPGASEERGDHP